jgi:dolichyl-phosphate beta-glucosyltransferase
MEKNIHLSVIIPAFNEEKRLPKTLSAINEYLRLQNYSYEIIVVASGSTDSTPKIVETLKGKIKGLEMVFEKESFGKGHAVIKGMEKASGKYRIFTDADNSTSINQVEKMWPWFEKGFDIVIGSRDIAGAVLDPPQPFLRKMILGKGFRILTQLICGTWRIKDTQCGFKGFSRKAAEDIFPKCRIHGFAFDPEILVIGKKYGYRIKEIPIYWKNDLESKVKFKSIAEMFFELLKIRRNLIAGKYSR